LGIERALAEPRRRHRASGPDRSRRAQPRHQAIAHHLPFGEPAHAAARSKFVAELRRDCDCVTGEVEAPYPTPISLMREMIADVCS